MGRLGSAIRKCTAVLLLSVTAAGIWGCEKTSRMVVVTVGGAGFSQMHDLRMALKREFPEARVVSAGAWDAYKTDIRKIVKAEPHEQVVLIGHSFGCGAIDEAADELEQVDLAVFIDPAWNDFTMSQAIDRNLWFKRSKFDLVREAKIHGAGDAKKIEGGHNDIPHSPELISQVVAEMQRISQQKPVALKKAGEMVNADRVKRGE